VSSRFHFYLRRAIAIGPRQTLLKIGALMLRHATARWQRHRDRRRLSYPAPSHQRLCRRLPPLDWNAAAPLAPVLDRLIPHYRAHRFDLLGSGWVTVAHGQAYAGFGRWRYPAAPPLPAGDWAQAVTAGHHADNRRRALSILSLIAVEDYTAIDWHVDFKSGYRWNPAIPCGDIRYGTIAGADVKVPWELARLQHLPHLALAHGAAPDPALPREFRHQVLDFLGSNPPGWGVNWSCAMDVAIRAVNILMAWDLFRSQDITFDDDFEAELAAAMIAHGRHIVARLEWDDHHRANHYLADIAGLAFIATYLPRSAESDCWLAFATHQLETEILRQFHPDGSNFEASTSYHQLSGEMALYAVALISGLPEDRRRALAEFDATLWTRHPPLPTAPLPWPPFSDDTFSRLAGIAAFAADITKPSGEIVQIGDNDSGRFLKLSPLFDGTTERHLDPAGLVAAAKGLFRLDLPTTPVTAMETAIVAALFQSHARPVPPRPVHRAETTLPTPAAGRLTRISIVLPDPTALDGLRHVAYPDFGLFLWRNPRTFISVRCGPIGQNGNGGHAHNDQLSVEIEIDGIGWATDPGTFVYTSDLAARRSYRSVMAHFAPRDGLSEPGCLDLPFRMQDHARARTMRADALGFVGQHNGFGRPVVRTVTIGGDGIVIEDRLDNEDPTTVEHIVRSPGDLQELWGLILPFSPGYGLIRP
jgi:hypothetical protein